MSFENCGGTGNASAAAKTVALPFGSIRQTRFLSATYRKRWNATIPFGSSRLVANGSALSPRMTMTAPSPSWSNSPIVVTYTRLSRPTTTDSGFLRPVTMGFGGAAPAGAPITTAASSSQRKRFKRGSPRGVLCDGALAPGRCGIGGPLVAGPDFGVGTVEDQVGLVVAEPAQRREELGPTGPEHVVVVAIVDVVEHLLALTEERAHAVAESVLFPLQRRAVDPVSLVQEAATLLQELAVFAKALLNLLQNGHQRVPVERPGVERPGQLIQLGDGRAVGGDHRANLLSGRATGGW